MGTDIHPVVERRVDGAWQVVKAPGGRYEHNTIAYSLSDRNYFLFGVLAGLRNYDVTPIAEPRDLPPDLSFDPQSWDEHVDDDGDWDEDDDRWLGEHSFSWVTLRELDEYPWETAIKADGWEDAFRDGSPMTFFLRDVMPWLRSLGPPDDVRLVFGFDS